MGIKPEEVLKQNRISTNGRIEKSDVKGSLKHYQEQRDCNYRRGQHEDDARSVDGPKKKLHALPSQARSAHFMNGHDEIQTGKDGGKSVYKNARRRGDHVRGEVVTAQRSVKSPAGIHSTRNQGVKRERHARNVNVPAQQVQLWKSEVTRADHHGH